MLEELVEARRDHCDQSSASLTTLELGAASSRRSLTTTWANSSLGGELLARDSQAPGHLLGVVGAAADEPGAQGVLRRRGDEDLQRLRHRLAHLARALDPISSRTGCRRGVRSSSSERSVP
jgi:hypothetical protein